MTFHHTTLDNGLEIIAELNDRAYSVAAGFFVKTGSRDEAPELAGVSHFLEHMTFKGTPSRDALAVNRDFDRVGAKHNAQTSEEDTFYHVTCLPEYLPRAFDVLSDILRPTLREDDFETEKKVIIEEIRMYLDNPMSVAYEAAKTAHFGAHPLGNSILGTVESITALRVDQMREYFARQVQPGQHRARLRRQGRLGPARRPRVEALQGLAGRPGLPAGPPGARHGRVPGDPPRRRTSSRRSSASATPPRWRPTTATRPTCSATILGDHTGSRLYWALIDPGYADGAELSYQDYNQAGTFFTFLSCEPDSTQENLGRIAEVYREVIDKGVTEDELTQAKNKVLARSVLRSERPMGRLASLGFHWVYRHAYLTVEDELEAFSRVTARRHPPRPDPVAALAHDHRLGRAHDGHPPAGVTATGRHPSGRPITAVRRPPEWAGTATRSLPRRPAGRAGRAPLGGLPGPGRSCARSNGLPSIFWF